MKYKELPYEVRRAVETYNINNELAVDCLEQALTIAKDHEGSMRALIEAYGEWNHVREKAREELHNMNYTDDQICQMAFLDFYPEEAEKRELPFTPPRA